MHAYLRMKQEYQDLVLRATNAKSLQIGAKIQTLWSGYGQIVRVHLQGCDRPSVVLKHVMLPLESQRSSGPETDVSHQRKVRSYQVETHWYRKYRTNEHCRIPECLAAEAFGAERLIVLEDLDASGFPVRKTGVRDGEIKACLSWIANFHALFLGVPPRDLWPVGTYWHLETRPDELEAIRDSTLKAAASEIDSTLNRCRFQTILHGDAKLENFCFSENGFRVAAVDFQYVGGGCGMKDVIYFLGSCLNQRECEERVPAYLDYYFSELRAAVVELGEKHVDFSELEKEWRGLFAFAWTDFYRFLQGWMPGHRKINRYSKRLAEEVLSKLGR